MIRRQAVRLDLVFNELDALIDGGVVDHAIGDRDDLVRMFAEEADFRARADGELCLVAGGGKAVCNEAGLEFAPEKGENFLPNRGIEEVCAERASGTG